MPKLPRRMPVSASETLLARPQPSATLTYDPPMSSPPEAETRTLALTGRAVGVVSLPSKPR